ncbi:hypothetical protein GDO86_020551 [Hymenochirus boettgeri]|uniref:Amidohydrolase-related domain-containing protein n=1 Tax=Hymenochirus boettgeri TaxID=247094 RepID=A0A8T2IBH3_9PIPI|nr:hypothetical protein GDO86_020551 [Hymenochirus boettgeri]
MHNNNICFFKSHISESSAEIEEVMNLYPQYSNYTEVYSKNNLLTDKTVMAHGCYLTDEELIKFKNNGSSISHCPNSNISLCSGHLDVRNVMKHKVKLGLGTDIAGGYSISMLDAVRKAIETSKILFMEREKRNKGNKATHNYQEQLKIQTELDDKNETENNEKNVLSTQEAFRLATLGGSEGFGTRFIFMILSGSGLVVCVYLELIVDLR